MSDYKRFLSYVYWYDGENKKSNFGFAKVELRGDRKRIDITLKKSSSKQEKTWGVYGLRRRENICITVPLGKMDFIGDNAKFSWSTIKEYIGDEKEKIRFEDLIGLVILANSEEKKGYVTLWDDEQFSFYNLQRKESHEQEEIKDTNEEIKDTNKENIVAPLHIAQADIELSDENELDKKELAMEDLVEGYYESKDIKMQEEIGQGTEEIEEVAEEKVASVENLEKVEYNGSHIIEREIENFDEHSFYRRLAQEPFAKYMGEESAKNENNIYIEYEIDEDNAENFQNINKSMEELGLKNITYRYPKYIRDNGEYENYLDEMKGDNEVEQEAEEQKEENQEEDQLVESEFFKEMETCFPKEYVCTYEPTIRCLRIKPADLGVLPKENWYLGNNSFLLHSYFNHRYLIVLRRKEEGEYKYYVGAPGTYLEREKAMANMFGFHTFIKDRQDTEKGSVKGFWCIPILGV